MPDLMDGVRGIAGRLRNSAPRQAELPDEALVDELAVRLGRRSARKSAALLDRLLAEMPERVRGRLAIQMPEATIEMAYEPSSIRLVLSSKAAALRARAAAKEPFTVAWLERSLRKGDVFYDVGANVGPYSLIAATLAGGSIPVYAFEPSAASYRDLCRNIALNGRGANVVPLPFALSNRTGLLSFGYHSLDAGAAQHTTDPGAAAAAVHVQTVAAFALDELVERLDLPVPTHMKVDVDGGELQVLEGAARTLALPECRSVLVELDVAGGAPDAAIGSFLEERGLLPAARYERDSPRAPGYGLYERRG